METEPINTETAEDRAKASVAAVAAAAIAELLDKNPVPVGCTVEFIRTVPYAGTEAAVTPVIRQPIDEGFAALPA